MPIGDKLQFFEQLNRQNSEKSMESGRERAKSLQPSPSPISNSNSPAKDQMRINTSPNNISIINILI